MWKNRLTCVAVNAVLLAFLFLSVSFNKEYLRPAFAGVPVLNVLVGSFSNFIAAYLISLFSACPILTKRINSAKETRIVVVAAIAVFVILTIEELTAIGGVSKVCDGYDVVASALGSSCAILTFVFLRRIILRGKNETKKSENQKQC